MCYLLLIALADAPKVERQPLASQAARVAQALKLAGAPLSKEDEETLEEAKKGDEAKAVKAIQAVLDRRALFVVRVGKKGVEAEAGAAPAELAEQGWRVFLVKVLNPEGVEKKRLVALSPNAVPLTMRSSGKPDPLVVSVGEVKNRFLDVAMLDGNPLVPVLSGLEVEYRLMAVYCRDAGRKEASFRFRLANADGKGDAGTSASVAATFDAVPAVLVKLKVEDFDGETKRHGRPIVAAFTFRDSQGRVHPSPARRLAPDFNFHS
ncbi:MAG: hypothetical protein K2W96_06840, partial [Gemmataceae bacterium]|nr:hypothetical protein [Gemmataceae bacterium]